MNGVVAVQVINAKLLTIKYHRASGGNLWNEPGGKRPRLAISVGLVERASVEISDEVFFGKEKRHVKNTG